MSPSSLPFSTFFSYFDLRRRRRKSSFPRSSKVLQLSRLPFHRRRRRRQQHPRRTRGDGSRRGLPPRIHGRHPFRPTALLLPREHRLPLRLRRFLRPPPHHLGLLPVHPIRYLPLRRRRSRRPDLYLHPGRPRLPPQLRPQPPRRSPPAARPEGRLPRLRPRTGRRRSQTRCDAASERRRPGRAGVLQRQLQLLLHAEFLIESFPLSDLLEPEEAVLLQHRSHGDRFGAVEGGRLHDEDGAVDGASEEDEDLRARFAAAVSAGVRREDSIG